MQAITSFEEIDCFVFKWRSWAWQVKNVTQAKTTLIPAVRAFRAGPTTKPLILCAQAAFWDLPRSVVEMVTEELGLRVDSAMDTFDVLWMTMKHILKESDDAIFEKMEKRLGSIMDTKAGAEEILLVDEAAQCLAQEDRKGLLDEQEHIREKVNEQKDFRSSYRQRRQAHRTGKPGSKKGGKKMIWKGPNEVPRRDHIEQSEAKRLMPPDSYLWRARTSNSWRSRYKAMPVKSCKDTTWGSEKESLLECVRHAWLGYLDVNGYSVEDCPLEGLFAPASGASASSSA